MPLVSRDGARVLRGPRDRGADERALRVHQGRPRGAARCGRDLHGGVSDDHRPWRVAAERVPDPGPGSVLRRDLLPARVASRAAELADGSGRDRRRLAQQARSDHPTGRRVRRDAWRDGAAGPLAGGDRRAGADRCAVDAARHLRPRQRRLRPCPEVSAGLHDRAAAVAGRARDVVGHVALDGPGRDLRPDRRWLRALLGRRDVDGPALREDAVRQRAAGAGVSARLAGDGRRAPAAGVLRDPRLGAARDARARGGLLRGARRGLRGRRGQVLRVDGGRAPRRARRALRRRGGVLPAGAVGGRTSPRGPGTRARVAPGDSLQALRRSLVARAARARRQAPDLVERADGRRAR